MNDSVRVRSDQKRVSARHLMHRHCHVWLTNAIKLVWASPGPEFYPAVPASWNDNNWLLDRDYEIFNRPHRLCVISNNTDLVQLQIPAPYSFVSTRHQQSYGVNLPGHSKNWTLNILHRHRLCLRLLIRVWVFIVLELPHIHSTVPASSSCKLAGLLVHGIRRRGR
jgi:hypothetical protein